MTTPPDIKTVGDLYNALDWTSAEANALRAAENTEIAMDAADRKAVRLEMIDKALWPQDTQEAQDAARLWLHHMGVWDDLVKYMKGIPPSEI
tara:strand:- start:7467 stop:7742 length:276 start_codon:yes stop_codon:yes gene_type:complete